jgi:hypothetical protein
MVDNTARACTPVNITINRAHFMEPECSLLCSQEPAAHLILFVRFVSWKRLNESTHHEFLAELITF